MNQFKWFASKNKNTYYAKRSVRRKDFRADIFMHREIMNAPEGLVDHADGDGLNNCKSNLIVRNNQANALNRHRQTNNTSGHIGVSWRKDMSKWKAQLGVDGKDVHLGYFDTKEEAAQVVELARIRCLEGRL